MATIKYTYENTPHANNSQTVAESYLRKICFEFFSPMSLVGFQLINSQRGPVYTTVFLVFIVKRFPVQAANYWKRSLVYEQVKQRRRCVNMWHLELQVPGFYCLWAEPDYQFYPVRNWSRWTVRTCRKIERARVIYGCFGAVCIILQYLAVNLNIKVFTWQTWHNEAPKPEDF